MHFPKTDSPSAHAGGRALSSLRLTVSIAALVSFSLLPVSARSHHSGRPHSASEPAAGAGPAASESRAVSAGSPFSDTAVGAALSCSHTAAVQMAAHVNAARRQVAPRLMTARQKRQLAHELRLAKKQGHAQAHAVRVAEQDKAIASGDVVRAAYAFRGTPYRMGGTSRSAFDCSGFVRFILSCADGVNLPRTAEEQYYSGIPVSRGELQPGDLVFFKNTYRHGISHVGIYVGNGKFVHAANPHKGVREDTLDTAYYQNHYAGARRVLPEQMRRFAAE